MFRVCQLWVAPRMLWCNAKLLVTCACTVSLLILAQCEVWEFHLGSCKAAWNSYSFSIMYDQLQYFVVTWTIEYGKLGGDVVKKQARMGPFAIQGGCILFNLENVWGFFVLGGGKDEKVLMKICQLCLCFICFLHGELSIKDPVKLTLDQLVSKGSQPYIEFWFFFGGGGVR